MTILMNYLHCKKKYFFAVVFTYFVCESGNILLLHNLDTIRDNVFDQLQTHHRTNPGSSIPYRSIKHFVDILNFSLVTDASKISFFEYIMEKSNKEILTILCKVLLFSLTHDTKYFDSADRINTKKTNSIFERLTQEGTPFSQEDREYAARVLQGEPEPSSSTP